MRMRLSIVRVINSSMCTIAGILRNFKSFSRDNSDYNEFLIFVSGYLEQVRIGHLEPPILYESHTHFASI
jgi:hypothetical protein